MSDLKNKSLFLPKSTLSKAPVGRQTARSSRLSHARVGSGGGGAGPCGVQPEPCCRARGGAERILWSSSIGSVSLQLLEGMKHLAYAPVPQNQWRFDIGGWEAGVGKASQDKLGCVWVHPDGAQCTRHRHVYFRPALCRWLWCECTALGVEGGPQDPQAPSRDSQRSKLSSQ